MNLSVLIHQLEVWSQITFVHLRDSLTEREQSQGNQEKRGLAQHHRLLQKLLRYPAEAWGKSLDIVRLFDPETAVKFAGSANADPVTALCAHRYLCFRRIGKPEQKITRYSGDARTDQDKHRC